MHFISKRPGEVAANIGAFTTTDPVRSLAAEWEESVCRVRAAHHRKTGFMRGFETLAAGAKRSQQPSFLELAKTPWGRRYERDEV